jgi:hypothetical protein
VADLRVPEHLLQVMQRPAGFEQLTAGDDASRCNAAKHSSMTSSVRDPIGRSPRRATVDDEVRELPQAASIVRAHCVGAPLDARGDKRLEADAAAERTIGKQQDQQRSVTPRPPPGSTRS